MIEASFKVFEVDGHFIQVDEDAADGAVRIHVQGADNEKYFGAADICISVSTAEQLSVALKRMVDNIRSR